jgi:hypothetical protein
MKKRLTHLRILATRAIILVVALTVLQPAHGQRRVMLYDDWFHSASCYLHREVIGDSITYCLAVTLDEGNISVPAGSKLQIRLRGAVNIELTSSRGTSRADVSRRRYATHTDRYVTCHYHIGESQLLQLHEHELLRLRIETAQGWIERRATRHMMLR